MPLYEYQCQDCGHELEMLQKFSDDPKTFCPECQKETLKKKVSAAGFRLSGGGWYETDFKSGDKKNLTKKEKEKGESKTSSKEKDSKTEKKDSGASGKSDKPKTAAKSAKD